jgi:threonine synthase
MTTVLAPNVHNIAIEGTFDDCQDLAKACFNDLAFRDRHRLTAVNSINFARVMAQIVYYFHAALSLGAPDRPVSFCVPTGNFGNIYAGYAARAMGLPVERLLIASNSNDILARFIESGEQRLAGVTPTWSPSMDIQVSSNFERFYFELKHGDAAALAAAMTEFRRRGTLPASESEWREAAALFAAARIDDEATLAEIAATHRATGVVLDPHSAVAVAAAKAKRRDKSVPMAALATAHPAKFPEAVERAIGQRPVLPPRLATLLDRPERTPHLANDLVAVQDYVRRYARALPAGALP